MKQDSSITMKYMIVPILLIALNLNAAVFLSADGRGQAISVPFYSVANNLNAILTLENTTDQHKIIKLHLKSSSDLSTLGSENLVLKPRQTLHMFLQDEVGYWLRRDIDYDPYCNAYPTSKGYINTIGLEPEYWQTGTIEVIEMAEFVQDDSFACETLLGAIEDNQAWTSDNDYNLSHPTGGIRAIMYFINVANGVMSQIPTYGFQGFFADQEIHLSPSNANTPNLSSGTNESLLIEKNGQPLVTRWSSGHEAISSLLMKSGIANRYEIWDAIGGQTEWVFSIPTLGYHVDGAQTQTPSEVTRPFRFWSNMFIFPRGFDHYYEYGGQLLGRAENCSINSPLCRHTMNAGVNIAVVANEQDTVTDAFLAGSVESAGVVRSNHMTLLLVDNIPEDGFSVQEITTGTIVYYLASSGHMMGQDVSTGETITLLGLPVTGFTFTVLFNANAQPGVLASYDITQEFTSHLTIIRE